MAYLFRKKLGDFGERLACNEYLRRGFVLVARNTYNKRGKQLGEIDLVMRTEKELVFVEVKTRTSSKFGSGAEAVNKQKQRKLIRIVNWFCRRFPQYNRLQPRIDVCVVEVDKTSVNVIIIPHAVTTDY